MPLRLKPSDKPQIDVLNKWADEVEKRLLNIENSNRFTAQGLQTHKNIFAHLFSNPHALQAAYNAAGIVHPSNQSLVGSSTTFSTGGLPVFTSTTTCPAGNGTVVWTWPTSTIYWPDNTQHTLPSSAQQGSITITGLACSTNYAFYPYLDYQLNKVTMVTSNCFASGSPQMAFAVTALGPPVTVTNGQAGVGIQGANGHLPLSNGSLIATTPGSGGSGGGGAGGGDAGCHPPYMIVERPWGQHARIEDVKVGDQLLGPEGVTTVLERKIVPNADWVRVALSNGEVYECAPLHNVVTVDGEKIAYELTLGDALLGKAGVHIVQGLEKFTLPSYKVVLHCAPFETFYIGKYKPTLVGHNSVRGNLT